MKNWISPGEHITLPAPSAVSSGAFVAVGAICGVAQGAAALGEEVVLVRRGVFDLPKVAAEAWAIGTKIYWDATAEAMTTTDTDNTLVGASVALVAGGAASGRVLLDGVIR
jgi:predicted RecA/RadA family phage recombinase